MVIGFEGEREMAKCSGDLALNVRHRDTLSLGDLAERQAVDLMQFEQFAPLGGQRGQRGTISGRIERTSVLRCRRLGGRAKHICLHRYGLPIPSEPAVQRSEQFREKATHRSSPIMS